MKKVISCLLTALMIFTIIPMATVNVSASTTLSYPPYAKVEYNYTTSVTTGTIRYISQIKSNSHFNSNYWGSWASQASSECGTSSISMALSYVGINKTPKQILDAHSGITYFSGWGESSYLSPSVSTAMSNYISGSGKYSPPIIHLPGYSTYGHYVILGGKVSNNVFQVIDPANSSVWNITIHGNTATYNGKTDTIDQVHQYYNANAPTPSERPKIPKISSINCEKENYAKITWSAVSGAVKYYVHICNSDWSKESFYSTSETSYELNDLSVGTYHIRIISCNSFGLECDNTKNSFETFKIVDRPEIPQIDSIVVDGSNAIINWSSVEGASKYVVHFCTPDWSKAYFYTTENLNFKLTGLDVGTYHVRVIAKTENGLASLATNNKFKDIKIVSTEPIEPTQPTEPSTQPPTQPDIEEKIKISSCSITLEYTSTTYSTKAKTPKVTVKNNSSVLIENTDYTVAYSNNVNAGTATVTITGIGNYTGTTTKTFTIKRKSFNDWDDVETKEIQYPASNIQSYWALPLNGYKLIKDTDYTVSVSGDIKVGNIVKVIYTGKGNFTGNKVFEFKIICNHNFEYLQANKAATCTSTGEKYKYCSICNKVVTEIIPKMDHSIIYGEGYRKETYFQTGYTGDDLCQYCGTVIYSGRTISKLKLKTPKFTINAGKKLLKIKYYKVTNATGFEIKYKIGNTGKTIRVMTKSSKTLTINKLKKGSYKVQIRAFIKSGNKYAYSNWTSIKTAKVK